MVEFEVAEGDTGKPTPVVEADSTPREAEQQATTNPYLSTGQQVPEPPAVEEASGFGPRPILYLCLIIYLAVSTYLKSGVQGSTAAGATDRRTSSSTSQHPDINGAYDGDDEELEADDEFGDFDDAESVSVHSTEKSPATSDTEYVASSTVSGGISMHKVKVLFCTACNYRRNFIELRQYLLQKYPQLDPESIEGENYPPPEPAASIAMLTQTLQLLSMPLLFFGDSIFGGEPPNWYRIMLENKMAIFFGLYMLNVFAQNAAQTGAFEIVHNGKVVFSKLEQQRLPNIQEIDVGLKRTGLIA